MIFFFFTDRETFEGPFHPEFCNSLGKEGRRIREREGKIKEGKEEIVNWDVQIRKNLQRRTAISKGGRFFYSRPKFLPAIKLNRGLNPSSNYLFDYKNAVYSIFN